MDDLREILLEILEFVLKWWWAIILVLIWVHLAYPNGIPEEATSLGRY